jgi:cysteine dioxygenase
MDLTIEQWFAELDQHFGRIPLEVLTKGLRRLRLDFPEVKKFAQFSPERYRRNLLHAGPAYHALILCWRSGQRSPIHDHRGSACAVRVIRGEATETVFEMTEEGRVFEARTLRLTEGFMCATQDLDIHQISNDQPAGSDLITLHIYSPPLLIMGQYSLNDSIPREFNDEVHTLTEGAGI